MNDSETTDRSDAGRHLVLERTFDAPIQLVWAMWTDPHHFRAWYGPAGATIPVASMDVRVGGRRLVAMEMQTPDGPVRMWFAGEYVAVEAPHRLVYTEAMADEQGNALTPDRSGMPADQLAETTVTVELTEVADGTRLVLTHVGVPADSPGATGWTMALDELTLRLAEAERS